MNLKDPSLLRQACLIGGQWTEADDKSVMAVANKATGETIGSVPGCGRAETERAIAAAGRAFPRWSAKTARERGRLLHAWHDLIVENIDDLALILTSEQGKPLAEAKGEIMAGCSYIDWFAEEGRRAVWES